MAQIIFINSILRNSVATTASGSSRYLYWLPCIEITSLWLSGSFSTNGTFNLITIKKATREIKDATTWVKEGRSKIKKWCTSIFLKGAYTEFIKLFKRQIICGLHMLINIKNKKTNNYGMKLVKIKFLFCFEQIIFAIWGKKIPGENKWVALLV